MWNYLKKKKKKKGTIRLIFPAESDQMLRCYFCAQSCFRCKAEGFSFPFKCQINTSSLALGFNQIFHLLSAFDVLAHCWSSLRTWNTHTLTHTHTHTHRCLLGSGIETKKKQKKTMRQRGERKNERKSTPEVACKLRWNADSANQIAGDGARLGGADVQWWWC